jgi:hypothetical protein
MSKLILFKGPIRKQGFAVNYSAVACFHESDGSPGDAVIKFIQGDNEVAGCPAKELHALFADAVVFEKCMASSAQFGKRLDVYVNRAAVIKVIAFEAAPERCEIHLRGDKGERCIQVAESIEAVMAKLTAPNNK